MVYYRTAYTGGHRVFYREAGKPGSPAALLLHGFPTSSHMFRDLIPLLADRYNVVAPDLPGFGNTVSPPRGQFDYTFDNLARVIGGFVEAVGLRRYALYVFDYGAPVGYRLALKHPDRVTAIISQNGNAYEEGLSDGWNPIRAYWQDASQTNREALRAFLAPGPLDDAPQTFVTLTRLDDLADRARLQRAVVEALPNVSTLDIAEVQQTIEGILDQVGAAIRFMAVFSLGAGAVVLLGAVTASRRGRTVCVTTRSSGAMGLPVAVFSVSRKRVSSPGAGTRVTPSARVTVIVTGD